MKAIQILWRRGLVPILRKWEVESSKWINLFPKGVQWIYGCNFSVRKSLLFELGGVNPDAFSDKRLWWYRGDGESGLLRKAHNAGKNVIYNPKAVLWHFIPTMTIEYFKERAFKRGIEAAVLHYRHNSNMLQSLKLLKRVSFSGVCFVIHNIFALIPKKNGIKHKMLSSRYKAGFLYELKLATDKNLRKIIMKECWLE